MQLNNLSLFFVLISISLALGQIQYAQIDLPGNCPKNITVVANSDLQALQGAWYVSHITRPDRMGCNKNCWSFYSNQVSAIESTVSICCVKSGKTFCQESIGTGSIVKGSPPGYFNYINQGMNIAGVILDASYDTNNGYWIGYVCLSQDDGTFIFDSYTFTRNPVPPASLDQFIVQTYQKNGIDTSGLQKVQQSRKCFKTYPFGCTRKTCRDWYYRQDL